MCCEQGVSFLLSSSWIHVPGTPMNSDVIVDSRCHNCCHGLLSERTQTTQQRHMRLTSWLKLQINQESMIFLCEYDLTNRPRQNPGPLNMGPGDWTGLTVSTRDHSVYAPSQWQIMLQSNVACMRPKQVEAEAELRGWQGFRGWAQIRSHAETTDYSRKLASALVHRWRRSGHATRSLAWLIPHIFLK